MKLPSEVKPRDYLISALLTSLGVAVQYAIVTLGGIPAPGLLYPTVFLTAWYLGLGPALTSIALALLSSNYFFYEPRFNFKVLDPSDQIRLIIFAITSFLAAWIVAQGKRAQLGEFKAKNDLKESLEVLETINRVGKSMSAELDLQKLVQHLTDAGTQLSKAQVGAFFYNVVNEKGEAYMLYTISGVPRELFSQYPMPRNTAVFSATFFGEGIIRSDDITKDPRYGKNDPYYGMPPGHFPVKSYLAIPVTSRTGEVIGGLFFGHTKVGIFTDREERIVLGLASQAAIAMDNARLFDKANQAIQIRDEFLSISSHELRTPLTPLKIQLQSIERHIEKGTFSSLSQDHLKKMLDVSIKQVNRITLLVDDLLDVSRISSGKLTLNFEEVDLVAITLEVIERYQQQLLMAHCSFTSTLPDSIVARIDKLRFEQVLINLLINAIKYAPGQPISIKLSQFNEHVVLEVSDHGPGISKVDQQRIFDRFERVNSNTAQAGLGLGLYIVHQIVSAHEGSIEIESQKGEGATFTVKFPLQPLVHFA